ncbi:MAG TPA: proton-conducting transporter membrane subunit [Spirochaetota bacterium]|nr:proton-conducting transporter membrane subunit [Spirochaetota bacterium]HPM33175.1 proton-conducting transporter membrane subunit [Spirochaetota bacterium]HPY01952.1 proton-conducting transporter membrane subunit [Spirochaetota bacterium]HQA51471.1 proton-conducting transporter membrane subunit [Spirochaetota bacterium]
MNKIFLAAALFSAGGILSVILPKKISKLVSFLFIIAGSFIILFSAMNYLLFSSVTGESISIMFSFPFKEVLFKIDSLSAFFLLILSCGFIFNSYSSYINSVKKKHSSRFDFFFLPVFYAAMILAVTVSHSIVFISLWEIMTLSSFALVMLNHSQIEDFPFKINYLAAMHIGMFILLGAFLYISADTSSFILSAPHHFKGIMFILLFCGFAFKAEFVPFHPWAPHLYPEMPAHVSAAFSGFMMKLGIYGIMRTFISFGEIPLWCGYAVLGISLATTFYGIIFAFVQRDIKRLLAYSSIENMGIIGIGIGSGIISFHYGYTTAGIFSFAGALIHALNHSIFKPLLFYSAEVVENITGTRDVEKLGGVMKYAPVAGTAFLVASLSICGIPLFAGFAGEFSIYIGLLKAIVKNPSAGNVVFSVLAISLLALSGAIALITFAKAFSVIFLGEKRSQHKFEKESAFSYFPLITLSLISFVSGIFPQFLVKLVSRPLLDIFGMEFYASFGYISQLFEKLSFVSILLSSAILVLCLIRYFLSKGRIRISDTWGCGYDKPSSRIQYTGFGFSENFSSSISGVLQQKDKKASASGLFPREAFFAARFFDIFESKIYYPMMKYFRHALSVFSNIQMGNTQIYVLYGLFFALAAVIWIIAGA